jgi:hypothetical protein
LNGTRQDLLDGDVQLQSVQVDTSPADLKKPMVFDRAIEKYDSSECGRVIVEESRDEQSVNFAVQRNTRPERKRRDWWRRELDPDKESGQETCRLKHRRVTQIDCEVAEVTEAWRRGRQ